MAEEELRTRSHVAPNNLPARLALDMEKRHRHAHIHREHAWKMDPGMALVRSIIERQSLEFIDLVSQMNPRHASTASQSDHAGENA